MYRKLASIMYLVRSDLNARYASSVLGPLWIVISFAILSCGLAFIWSQIYNQDIEKTFPYFSTGLLVWMFLSAVVAQGPNHLVERRELLLNIKYPKENLTLLVVFHHLITFVYNLLFLVPMLIFFNVQFSFIALFSLLGLFLVTLQLYLIAGILGYLGAKYRDISPLINAVIQPLFFLTPVIFRPDSLNNYKWMLSLNPFTHYINVIRDPLLEGKINPISFAFMIVGILLSHLFLRVIKIKKEKYFSFWIH